MEKPKLKQDDPEIRAWMALLYDAFEKDGEDGIKRMLMKMAPGKESLGKPKPASSNAPPPVRKPN